LGIANSNSHFFNWLEIIVNTPCLYQQPQVLIDYDCPPQLRGTIEDKDTARPRLFRNKGKIKNQEWRNGIRHTRISKEIVGLNLIHLY